MREGRRRYDLGWVGRKEVNRKIGGEKGEWLREEKDERRKGKV